MRPGNSIFKELESESEVPAHLKAALISEMDIIRDSMHVATHFTEHLLSALAICISPLNNEPDR
jgi:hypothetical protein